MMRPKLVVSGFCLLMAGVCFSQVTDNFSDGNFTSAPAWLGNDTDFVVNANQQLQLNSSGADTSYLALSNTQSLNNCEWNFWINLNFAPSGNNFARVYLVSDKADLSGSLNGYYLQFGENGSADQVELFSQGGTAKTSVCRGTTNISTAFAIRVKVTRDNAGLWQLFIDPAGGTNYALEASGTDNSFSATSHFGVYCKYTSSNATKFFFDDFYIYSPPDVTPATLDSVVVVASNKIDAYFSEPLSAVSAQTVANYSCDNGIGFAAAAVQDAGDPRLVHLTMVNSFVNGQYYTLTVTGVQDLAGNNTINSQKQFFFFVPAANDILINEIMADINPVPNTLPPYEYIELYNRTGYAARLKNWTISDATSTVTIPEIVIQPDSFYILASTTGAFAFSSYGPAAGVISFPLLNDTGDDLVLRDNAGNIISIAFYTTEWYNDAVKDDGGWSMEQVDPDSPCGGKSNWRASADNSGGTPGRTNSVNAAAGDAEAPVTSHIVVMDPLTIKLFFSEPMDSSTLMTTMNYFIDNGMGSPVSANPVEPDYSSVVLALPSAIVANTIYLLTVNNVRDCAGNTVSAGGNTEQFGLAVPAGAGDLAINEILFDPKDGGVEWIEIYNRSDKIIDLKEIYFCSRDLTGNLSEIEQVSPGGYLCLPGSYVVLSEDEALVKSHYSTPNPEGFVDMASIPSLNNDSDIVVLANAAQQVIDEVKYFSSWHLPLMSETKGFSLERINYGSSAQDENNWHTAAESIGGATPAYKNSQYTDGTGGDNIIVSPEVFSPDNDGYNDVLSISYAFDTPGMVGNVHIYDSRGRLIKNLVRNELLAASGTFFWDGITDEKTKARIGIYIIWLEAFDTKGSVKHYKKPCVVGGK